MTGPGPLGRRRRRRPGYRVDRRGQVDTFHGRDAARGDWAVARFGHRPVVVRRGGIGGWICDHGVRVADPGAAGGVGLVGFGVAMIAPQVLRPRATSVAAGCSRSWLRSDTPRSSAGRRSSDGWRTQVRHTEGDAAAARAVLRAGGHHAVDAGDRARAGRDRQRVSLAANAEAGAAPRRSDTPSSHRDGRSHNQIGHPTGYPTRVGRCQRTATSGRTPSLRAAAAQAVATSSSGCTSRSTTSAPRPRARRPRGAPPPVERA